jgi:predicted DsbA family dithiol-disulfide isomerase
MSTQRERITVYSDYVCPFCYLGRLSLAEYRKRRETPLDVNWHPFDLRAHRRGPDGGIDHSVDDGKDEDYFDQVEENLNRLRERYGADDMLGLDELPDEVDSLDAQVASHYVMEEHPSEWAAFDWAVFEALWIDGRDVGSGAVLGAVAEEVGLDGDAVRGAIDDEMRRQRIHEQFAAAREDGVTGVPTFAYDGYAARGAVPPEQIERLVEGARP